MALINKIVRPHDFWVLVGAFLVVQALAPMLVGRFMFHPVKDGYSESTPGFVDIGTNGVRIAAVVVGPRHGKAAILYCHGNAEDACSVSDRFASLAAAGYTVAAVDYPGYGPSDGHTDESGCYRNAHRLYDWLTNDCGFSTNDVFVVGYSIGTGVAVELAASRPVAGLWLEAPFLSAPRIVTRIRLLAIDPFPSWSRIGQINCPLYVVHGTSDEVVPYSQGRALYDLAKDPKEFLPIPNAGHTDFFEVYGVERYTEKMLVFLRHQENNQKIGEP